MSDLMLENTLDDMADELAELQGYTNFDNYLISEGEQ